MKIAILHDALGVAFTGSGSTAFFLTTHKVLAKRLLRADGLPTPWILELNANPCLSPGAGFLAAAGRAGLEEHPVVARIVAAVRS